jgi:serine/threonine protein kinase
MVEELNVANKQTLLGTPNYLPIEILIGEKYSSKCDVFSVGILLYEMVNLLIKFFGKHPFYKNPKFATIF